MGVLGFLLLLPFVFLVGLAALRVLDESSSLEHLFVQVLPDVIAQTLWLCAGVAVLTSTMGVLPAWWVSAHEFSGRRWLEWLLMLPIAMPSYVVAYAYTDGLQYSGRLMSWCRQVLGADFRVPDIRSLGGAVLVLSFVLYPYVYIMARTAFLRCSPSMLDAARSLGLGAVGVFCRVVLPVSRPAWVAGLALVLMETLSEYGALSYFGVQTFTTAIFKAWFGLSDKGSAALLAVMLMGLMLGLIVFEMRARGRAQFYTQSGKEQLPVRAQLNWHQNVWVVFLCSMPVLFGFVLPMVFLLCAVAKANMTYMSWATSLAWMWHSVVLAVLAATVACVLAVFFGYVKRLSVAGWVLFVHRLLSLGYGVPGAIVAIAVLLQLSAFDRLSDHMGWGAPLLVGSVFALVYAYCVRFTSAALQSVDSGLQQITRHIDESARVLGCTPRLVLWRVHLPLLRGAIATGFLLVFVDVMKELPATVMLRFLDFDTLAAMADHFAADERLEEAAIPSLLIVLITLLPTVLLIRQAARQVR